MSITAIIVEILIVGFISSIWIILTIFSIFGYEWVQPFFKYLKGWEAFASLFFISFCYVIGIFTDRAADALSVLLNPKNILLKSNWIQHKSEVAHSDNRMKIMRIENKATDFLEHIRSRIRIVRSIVLNLPLISISLLCFLFIQTRHTSWEIVIIILVGLFGSFLFFLCLGMLEVTYSKRLEQAWPSSDNEEI